ncbi:MAG TPA: AAA family ATPase, partial [Polyangiales bacterium]|nr:AAA family ATPase [Polyangiales bacterium]
MSLASFEAAHDATGAVRVSPQYQLLVDREYRFEPAPPVQTIWLSKPLPSMWLVGLRDLATQELAQFVGRHAELQQLGEAFRTSVTHGNVILLRGAAGIGKSRLVREFHRALPTASQSVVRLSFSPELQHVAFGGVLQFLQSELLDRSAALEDVARLLRDYDLYKHEAVSALGTWLGLAFAPPYAALPHSPQVQRAMVQAHLSELMTRVCTRRNAYLLVEDLHWADRPSLEWLEAVLVRLEVERRFALVTSRSDLELTWERFTPQTMELTELDRISARALALTVSGADRLLPQQLDAIAIRGAGTPIYLEELTRAAIRDEQPSPNVALPDVLRDVMLRQVDRVGPAKRTLRVAAVVGGEFEQSLLLDITGKSQRELLPELELLVSHQLIERMPSPSGASFAFRHALLREAAYDSIPASEARDIHLRLARLLSLESGFTNPSRAARHYQQAGAHEAAIPQFVAASQRAIALAAHQQARAEVDLGFASLAQLEASPKRDELELELIRHSAAWIFQQYGAALPEEGVALFDRGAELLERVSLDSERAFLFRRMLWEATHVRPDQRAARVIAERLVEQADAIGSPMLRLAAADAAGRTAFFMGNIREALSHFEGGLRLHEPSLAPQLGAWFVVDPAINCYSFSALGYLFRGELARAAATYAEALRCSE